MRNCVTQRSFVRSNLVKIVKKMFLKKGQVRVADKVVKVWRNKVIMRDLWKTGLAIPCTKGTYKNKMDLLDI